jgi:ribosomal protein S18 acetylase RimI-like enzyme
MDFSLVEATDSDFKFLLSLRLETMDVHLKTAGINLTQQEHKDRVLFKYNLSKILVFDNNKGGLLKLEERESEIEVLQFQILPKFQGKGYGQEVIAYLCNYAGKKSIKLNVLKQNPAYRLYQKMGFTKFGEDKYEYHLQYQL